MNHVKLLAHGREVCVCIEQFQKYWWFSHWLHVKMTSKFLKICTVYRKRNWDKLVVRQTPFCKGDSIFTLWKYIGNTFFQFLPVSWNVISPPPLMTFHETERKQNNLFCFLPVSWNVISGGGAYYISRNWKKLEETQKKVLYIEQVIHNKKRGSFKPWMICSSAIPAPCSP